METKPEKRTMPEKIDSSVEVNVEEALGVIFLGIVAVVLLIAFLRSQQQLREAIRGEKMGRG